MNLSLDLSVLVAYKGQTMLAAPKTPISQTLRAKPAVVFAVMLLAALQFTTATHQFDHSANDLGDVCSFCLQLDRLDDISSADSVAVSLASAGTGQIELTRPHVVVRRTAFSQPRAPPLS